MKEKKGYVFESCGKWYARITVTDESGKRRNIKRTAGSKTEAREMLKQIAAQLNDAGSKAIDNLRKTFNDLADFYEANYAVPVQFQNNQKVCGLRNLVNVRHYLTCYRDYFGKKKLRDISYSDLRSYRTKRFEVLTQYKRQRTVASMNRELVYLRRMLNIALQQGWIDRNPFNAGDPLILTSCERRRERILSPEEESRLLAACEHPQRHHLRPLLIALLDTGCRKSEMLKLRWRDVSLHTRTITIRAENTKTLKERTVAITQRLQMELAVLWDRSDKNIDSRVFGIADNVRNSFAKACAEAGIKHGGIDGLTLHCLRHTAATRLVKGQLPIQLVGRILGHTQVNTTYRYLSVDNDTAKQAAAILESYQAPQAQQVNEAAAYVN